MAIPVFDTPGYGAQFASLQAAGDKSKSDAVSAQLGNYADVIRSLMSNAKDIAAVSGSGTLDTLAQQFGGAQDLPIFGGEGSYGSTIDDLRLSALRADIGAKNRQGLGGGGGAGGADKAKQGIRVRVTYPGTGIVEEHTVKLGDVDQLAGFRTMGAQVDMIGGAGEGVADTSAATPSAVPGGTAAPVDSVSAATEALTGPVTGAAAQGPAGDPISDVINRINNDPASKVTAERVGSKVYVTDKDTNEVRQFGE